FDDFAELRTERCFFVLVLDRQSPQAAARDELRLGQLGRLAQSVNGALYVVLHDLPSTTIPLDELRSVARLRADVEHRSANCHRAVNFARVNDAWHFASQRHYVEIRTRQAVLDL